MGVLKQNFKSPPTEERTREGGQWRHAACRYLQVSESQETERMSIKRSSTRSIHVIKAVGCLICAAFRGHGSSQPSVLEFMKSSVSS